MSFPEAMHWYFSVPVGIAISIIGLIGNCISILVWKRILSSNRSSLKTRNTGVYLIVLGFVDSSLLVFFLLQDSLKALFPSVNETYAFAVLYSYVFFPLFFFFIFASIWLVVSVTLDRYLLISKNRIVGVRKSLWGVVIVLFFGFTINFPHFFNYRPVPLESATTSDDESVRWTYQATAYGRSMRCSEYEFWLHCMFIVIFPWLSILMLNFMIIRTIFVSTSNVINNLEVDKKGVNTVCDKLKCGGSRRLEQDRQVTFLLLTVTFVFLILMAWQCVNQCFWMKKFGQYSLLSVWDKVDASYAVAKLGAVINSSINSLLYCLSGSIFRKELRKLFHCGKKRRSNFK